MLGQNHARIGGNMAIWNDIKLWMASQNITFTDEGEFIDIIFNFTDRDRTQQLRVQHTPLDTGTDAITFLSFIAQYNPLKTESLLLEAYGGVAGVAIQSFPDGSKYFVLKATVPLSEIDSAGIDFHMTAIAARADALEELIFRVDDL